MLRMFTGVSLKVISIKGSKFKVKAIARGRFYGKFLDGWQGFILVEFFLTYRKKLNIFKRLDVI